MINNTCPPLHKLACINGAWPGGFYPTRAAGQRLPDPRTCWACGHCEPVPVETEHKPAIEPSSTFRRQVERNANQQGNQKGYQQRQRRYAALIRDH